MLEESEDKPTKYGTEMYSTHNEGKSVIAERFIRTLKRSLLM